MVKHSGLGERGALFRKARNLLAMFQETCKSLLLTVQPIVVAWRYKRGNVECGIGAGMFVNADGWFITAGHILDQIRKLHMAVTSSSKRKLRNTDVTHYVFMIGKRSGGRIETRVKLGIDLGLCKVEGVQPPTNYVLPKFRVRDVEQGELLCRAGYPFIATQQQVKWTTDKGFEFTNVFPVPMFVNEALVSRFANVQIDGRLEGQWIETSSPGLKGQSGGPLARIMHDVPDSASGRR